MHTETLTTTGCFLDNHRGHYITRDVIDLAVAYGFIIDGFARWAVANYGRANEDDLVGDFPFHEMVDLHDAAVEWLNSGQEKCSPCGGTGKVLDVGVICSHCSGTGRGPRIPGQNFPPVIPDGYAWGFCDGDFGLYSAYDLET